MPMDDVKYSLVTSETFNAEAYLLANPDVASFVRGGGNARQHFDLFGKNEGRKQLVFETSERLAHKYERFRHVLDADAGENGQFRFLHGDGTFPVAYGDASHSIGEYLFESANRGFAPFVSEIEENPDKLYLDVGCGRREHTYNNCLYLEVYPSISADIIMHPACAYPIASNSIDGIGCFAVLEHVAEPWRAAEEFLRILKPGGKVFIDWPFLQPVHGFPSHYYNATRYGLQRLFDKGFECLMLETLNNQTPDYTITWVLSALVNSLTDEKVRDEMLSKTVAELLAEAPRSEFWMRVDQATPDETTIGLACGNTLVARKL